jgi:hypothetical protein
MPSQDFPNHDPSIRLQRSASQLSRGNSLILKDETLRPGTDMSTMPGNPTASSPLAQSFEMSRSASQSGLYEDYTDTTGTVADGPLHRSPSAASMSRSNILRKQKSLSRRNSLKRSSSKRSVRAGSIGGITYDDTSGIDKRSVYYTPVPTSGAPTEILANRFQGMEPFILAVLLLMFPSLEKVSQRTNQLFPRGSKFVRKSCKAINQSLQCHWRSVCSTRISRRRRSW